MLGVPDWRVLVGKRHARWIGHVARMSTDSLARISLYGYAEGRVKKKSGLRQNLVHRAEQILAGLCVDVRVWGHIAQDKAAWNTQCKNWCTNPTPLAVDEKTCPVCNKQFTKAGSCSRHITAVHPVRRQEFSCHICHATFVTKTAQTKHLERQHGVGAARPFSCPFDFAGCSNGPFKTLSELRQHIKRKHVQ